MDTSDPEIEFLDDGTCNHCNGFLFRKQTLPTGAERDVILESLVAEIKASGEGNEYDCIIGVSGGRDSTYVAYAVKELGLRPLAVHLDNGWDSELAVHNIQKTLQVLDIDLETVVLNWDEFKKLQYAFICSSTADMEVPTDHAIRTALLKTARKHGIKYILNGRNYSTEGILPVAWSYGPFDWRYMKALHRRFIGGGPREFPHLNLATYLWYTIVYRPHDIDILNLVPYEKEASTRVLVDKLGWTEYGDKHYESVWTRFFQGYILPKKFGYDKRRAHLSVLMLNGLLTRDEGLARLEDKTYLRTMADDDKEYVAKKFDHTVEEFDEILAKPNRSFRDYPNNSAIFLPRENRFMLQALRLAARLHILPKTFGRNLLKYKDGEISA